MTAAEIKARETLANDALAELAATEPAHVADTPFDTDVLDAKSDSTIGLWRITWFTGADDPNGARNLGR